MNKTTNIIPFLLFLLLSIKLCYGDTYIGCFNSVSGFKSIGAYTWQSTGYCSGHCKNLGNSVYGLHGGDTCYCGDSLPASSAKVSENNCNVNCTGYGTTMCGGAEAFSVYTIIGANVESNGDSSSSTLPSSTQPSSTSTGTSSSSPSSSSSSDPSTSSSTSTASSPLSSSSPSSSSSTSSSSSSSSTNSATHTPTGEPHKAKGISGGAIAGIVIGVIAALGIIGGTLVFLKKRRSAYDHYSPSTSPDRFKEPFGVRNDLPFGPTPPTSGVPPFQVDQRLNPVMLGERRISVGSLADARDYSRKILRVANPDDDA